MLLVRHAEDGVFTTILSFRLRRHSDQVVGAKIMRLRTSHVLGQLFVDAKAVAGISGGNSVELRVVGNVVRTITDSRFIHPFSNRFRDSGL